MKRAYVLLVAAHCAAISRAGSLDFKVYYSTFDYPNDAVWSVNGDGSENTQIIPGEWPRISPDGTRLLYHPRGHPENIARNDLAVFTLANGTTSTLYQNGDFLVAYDWARDGSRVIYDFGCGIYSVFPDATGYSNLFVTDCTDDAPSVNPTNGTLVFHNSSGLAIASGDGSGRRRIDNTVAGDYWPTWSLDGQWIAFGNNNGYFKIHPDGTGRTNLWVSLSGASQVVDAGGYKFARAYFSPDGQWLTAAFNLNGTNGIYAVAADGSGAVIPIRTVPPPAQIFNFIGGTVPLDGPGTTINLSNRMAYGANIGWIDGRGDSRHGAIIGEYVCSGYIYSANFGWIHLGTGRPANRIQYLNNSATDYGVNVDLEGNLRGYAYGANLGWIRFEDVGVPRVDLATGIFTGFAWCGNWGWISLNSSKALVQTDVLQKGDSDSNGLPIAWELTHFGQTGVDPAADPDQDGISNFQEYLAGTDPLNGEDRLVITSETVSPEGAKAFLKWNVVSSRWYAIEKTLSLSPPEWVDSGLGVVSAQGSPAVIDLTNDSAPSHFFRVRAFRPLMP